MDSFDRQMGDRIHPSAHHFDIGKFLLQENRIYICSCTQTGIDGLMKEGQTGKFRVSADDRQRNLDLPLSHWESQSIFYFVPQEFGQLSQLLPLLVRNTIYLKGVELDIYENEWHRPILRKDLLGQQSCIWSQSAGFDLLNSSNEPLYLCLHLYLYLYWRSKTLKCGPWSRHSIDPSCAFDSAQLLPPRLV